MALEILAAHHSNKSASECGLLYKSPRSVSVDLYQGFYSSATGSQQNRELSGSSNMTMQTAGRGLVVRGPVHGYLSVAAHKRLVVDTPITQRLRRIAQTGLAEMSSPKQKHRGSFIALGAMHLASRFIVAALENGSQADIESFFDEVEGEIDWKAACVD